MTLPWHKIGLPAGRGGTLPELKAYYGDAWSTLTKYFLPTKRLAPTVACPKPGGEGCPRQVVEHSFNDIVGVCGNSPRECESVRLSRKDLIIHELKTERLLADLANFLQIKASSPRQCLPLTWELGTYAVPDQPYISVSVSLLADPDRLQIAAISLIAQKEKPFVLLIPSRVTCSIHLADTIKKAGVHLVGLDELHGTQKNVNGTDLLGKYISIVQEGKQKENVFRKNGQKWVISFNGSDDIFCNDNKGFLYISYLLGYPGREIHCQQLRASGTGVAVEDAVGFGGVRRQDPEDRKLEGYGQHNSNGGPQEPLFDEKALKEYKEHAFKLRQLIEQAESDRDFARKKRYEKEYKSLSREIIAASKLGGGSRDAVDDAEKARKSVSQAVRRAMKIIEIVRHP